MRVLRQLTAFVFLLLVVAVVIGGLEAYLAATGKSVFLLRAAVTRLGHVMAGQRTEEIELDVRVHPPAERISGTTRLTVRSTVEGRRLLYFLLNHGLSVREAWQEDAGGHRTPLPCYRLWLVTVIELPEPLAENGKIRVGLRYDGELRATGLGSARVLGGEGMVAGAHDFWYPADLQGFFSADVEVTLPRDLTVVHNGHLLADDAVGTSHTVRWTTHRPVVGLALVAGRYRIFEDEREAVRYRVHLPEDADLDAEAILSRLAASHGRLRSFYGPVGSPSVTLFVQRGLGRAFHDGGGVIGLPVEALADGQYGFATIARETAHEWWGATVAEKWLQPGTGGQWITEGFAELSSWLVVRSELGESALLRLIEERAYDPGRDEALVRFSAIEAGLDPASREIIRGKGGHVALMLYERLGEDVFDDAAHDFIERFRYRTASAGDLQRSFEESAGQDLDEFFAAWVRGAGTLDLALDPENGGASARNYGTASPPSEIDLWRLPPSAEPERQRIAAGATTPLGNAERLVLDPLGRTPDAMRANNVLPRRENPRLVARSARGEIMVVNGEPHPWSPANVVVLDGGGRPRQTWPFDSGLLGDPVWSADGSRILTGERTQRGRRDLLALHATDGSRQRIGDHAPASAAAEGTYVAEGDRLVRLSARARETVVRQPGANISAPLVSPDGSHVAYASIGDDGMDLRVVRSDGGGDRLLLAWRSSGVRWRWSADGARLYAVLSGDWDWQLWELPVTNGEPRALVREATMITDLAVEPDGTRVAIVAEASLAPGRARSEVFVLEPSSGAAERFNLSGANAHAVAWLDTESLAVIVSDPIFPTLPRQQELRRLRLSDGSLLEWF
jgi:hypothetical protein